MIKPEDNMGGTWKLMIVSSFIMLSVLTWAAGPIQKVFENIQHKETIKAKVQVCSHIRARIALYKDWAHKLFSSGCIYQVRSFFLAYVPEREAEIEQQWKDQKGLDWDRWIDVCSDAASANERENRVTDRVLTPIYFEEMKCPEVFDEAKKLEIEADDVQ